MSKSVAKLFRCHPTDKVGMRLGVITVMPWSAESVYHPRHSGEDILGSKRANAKVSHSQILQTIELEVWPNTRH